MGAGLGLLCACLDLGTFPCQRDAQCELDGRVGLCLTPGYCALPDDTCESGYRWHTRSVPTDLAGKCTAKLDESSSSPGPQPSGPQPSGPQPSSSGSSTSPSSATLSSDDYSTTTGSSCGDHPCPCTASVATGDNHTCVVRTDGRVLCWGADSWGQLGQGPGEGPVQELQYVVIPSGVPIDVVQAGNDSTCARGSDDTLWCWGDNNNGEITTPADSPPSEVSPTALPLDWIPGALGQGRGHTCIGDAMGSGVRCLGNNSNGELGGGGAQPVDGAVPEMNAVDQLALGNDHTCARAAGQVWCWGRDNLGQLGQNMVPGPTADPVPVSLPGDASLLVSGNNHVCAAIDEGETVWCWGEGHRGQIGDGQTDNRQLPHVVGMPLPAPVVKMDATSDTTCALLADNSLWCWGAADQGGRLGTDPAIDTPLLLPTPVLTVEALPEPPVDIALGMHHLCGRAESGRTWCWGRNTSWQLGPHPSLPGVNAVELDVECPDR